MSETAWRSSSQAADYLGVSTRTLYRLANDGQVGGYRIGRVLRFLTGDLDEYLARVRLRPGDLDHLVQGQQPALDDPEDDGEEER